MPAKKDETAPVVSEAEPQSEAPQEAASSLPEIDEDSMDSLVDQRREVTEEEQRETNVVRYIGVLSERQMSAQDWENAGVPDQEAVTWTRTAPAVPLDQFSEEALRALSTSGEFQIVRDET